MDDARAGSLGFGRRGWCLWELVPPLQPGTPPLPCEWGAPGHRNPIPGAAVAGGSGPGRRMELLCLLKPKSENLRHPEAGAADGWGAWARVTKGFSLSRLTHTGAGERGCLRSCLAARGQRWFSGHSSRLLPPQVQPSTLKQGFASPTPRVTLLGHGDMSQEVGPEEEGGCTGRARGTLLTSYHPSLITSRSRVGVGELREPHTPLAPLQGSPGPPAGKRAGKGCPERGPAGCWPGLGCGRHERHPATDLPPVDFRADPDLARDDGDLETLEGQKVKAGCREPAGHQNLDDIGVAEHGWDAPQLSFQVK